MSGETDPAPFDAVLALAADDPDLPEDGKYPVAAG